jgi:hypothetical protein
LAAFFGEKGGTGGRREEGRCNSFTIIYAWCITAGMDPRNLYKWEARIGAPLTWLVSKGYAIKAFKETKAAYRMDILGVEYESEGEEQAAPM